MRTLVLPVLSSALVLGACSPPREAPPVDGMAQACRAAAAMDAIGQDATAARVEQARRAAGAATARVLAPGQVVTMEFRADRLNLEVDAGNRVTAVRCG